MSKTYKDSPKPLRMADPNPLFPMVDEGYVVKSLSPMERQRRLDGTQHTMMRPSTLEPKGIDLYLSGDKIDKSIPIVEAKSLDAAAIIKSFMESK